MSLLDHLTTIGIFSPKQDLDSLFEKARLFMAAEVKSCWIVPPTVGTVVVFTGLGTYQSFANGMVLDVTLGIEIPQADIFS